MMPPTLWLAPLSFLFGGMAGAALLRARHGRTDSAPLEEAFQARQQIDAILSHLPAILWSVNADGCFTHYDAKASAISGKRPEEMIGRNVFELFPGTEPGVDHIRRALKGESSRYRSQLNGIQLESDIAPLYDTQGRICGAAGVSFDITKRIEQEHRLEKWETIFRSASWGMCVALPDGTFSRVNAAFVRMHGGTPESWKGRSILDVFAKEYRQNVPAVLAELDANGYTKHISPHLRADGTTFPTLAQISAIHDAEGNLLYRVANIFDLTDQKKAETELAALLREKNDLLERETHARSELEATVVRLQAALKEIDEIKFALHQSSIVATNDIDGRITFANENFCRISQYSREELIGRDYALLNSGYHSHEFKQDLRSTIASGKVWRGEIKCLAKDRTAYWIDASIVPVLDNSGQPVQYISISTDITAKKNMEEAQAALAVRERAAIEASRLKNVFLANVSHEIRTPLNGVIGMARLLERANLETRQAEYVSAIRSSAEMLLQVVNDVIDISKIEAGKLDLHEEDFDVSKLTDSLVTLLNPEAEAKGIRLHASFSGQVPRWLRGDSVRVRQMITNLVGNAIKFTDRGEVYLRVSLAAVRAGAFRLRFEVTDTGMGIAPSAAEKLFLPFSQVDDSASRQHGGSGLGLSICKQLVERMGGTIGFSSEEGKGSSFWFEVEMRAASPLSTDIECLKKPAAKPGALRARVAMAEDNAVNRTIALAYLDQLGVEAKAVKNGQELLELLAREKFDLVLMDCQMPGMDGYAATRAIRAADGTGQRLPIIAMTAHALIGDRERCLAAGMDDYIAKPFAPVELEEALRRNL